MIVTLRVRRPLWIAGLALVSAAFGGAQLPELAYADSNGPGPVVVHADTVASPLAADSPAAAPGEATVPAVVPAAPPVVAPVPPPAATTAQTVPVTAAKAPAKTATTTATKAAATSDNCSGAGWEQRRGAAALATLRSAPASAYSLTFLPGRSGLLGLTKPSSRSIDVYVRSCSAESDALLAHVTAHELGHAWDKAHLTDAQHAAWLAARGIPAGTPWQGCSGCADFATPAGDFAEVYAQWRTGASSNLSKIAGDPGAAELAALASQFFGG